MSSESRHHKMVDIHSCVKHLKELIDCNYLVGVENPTQEDIEHSVREWWVGDD